MRFYLTVMLVLTLGLCGQCAFARWDEERDVTGSGNPVFVVGTSESYKRA